MEYQNLGQSDLSVSRISLGCRTFGREVDEQTSVEIIHQAVDAGINLFDTADIYGSGSSEEILGRALKGRRDKAVITTHLLSGMGHGRSNMANPRFLTRQDILQRAEASLLRLDTDYIDLYQIADRGIGSSMDEALHAQDDLVRQGKVRFFGGFQFPAWRICKVLWLSEVQNLAPIVSCEATYSISNRQRERELVPFCLEQNIGFLAISVLDGGMLTGKYTRGNPAPSGSRRANTSISWNMGGEMSDDDHIFDIVEHLKPLAQKRGVTSAQLAIAWVLAQRGVSSAMIGATSVTQLQENLGALDLSMTEEELAAINEFASGPRMLGRVPSTQPA